jgi:cytochrome c biogenesis protein CcdA
MNEVAFAASAGMLAAFNPCGFALLPTYLALFLGSPGSTSSATRRALVVGGAVTIGFVAVFGAVGAGLVLLSLTLGAWLSYVTIGAGIVLVGVGGWLLAGRELTVRLPRARLVVSGSVPGMVAYGVVYATVSLSCTLPVFLAAVVYVFAAPGSSPVRGATAAVSYAAGMGLVLTSLALVAAVVGGAATQRLRSWTRHVGRASGVVALVAGAYVVWYGWVEATTLRGASVATGPVRWVTLASGSVSQAVNRLGPLPLGAFAVSLFSAVALTGLLRRRGRPGPRQEDDSGIMSE